MATDSTFAWGEDFERHWGEGDNRYFRKFWRNVVRWLSENSLAGSRRLHVETDKIIYRPGERVRLTATAFNEALEQTTAYGLTAGWAAADADAAAPLTTDLAADAALQVYRGELTARAGEGLTVKPASTHAVMREARLEVASADEAGDEVARTSVEIQLLDDSIEFLAPQPAPENLEILAELSGGRVLRGPSEVAELLREVQPSEGEVLVYQTPLWDRPLLWLLLLGLLAIEWSLRRRAGFG
jgi:hypothetical protein